MAEMNQGAAGETPPAAHAARWRLRDRVLDLSAPRIVAICNVTPDSFSDGGVHLSVDAALRFAEVALRDGASVLDIGGESTRPGATPVAIEVEIGRVVPVVEAIRDALPELILSVDTVKSAVARAALEAGAHAINDVSAGRLDPGIFEVAAAHEAGMILMHSRGGIGSMASYRLAEYGDDLVGDICRELTASVQLAHAAGVPSERIVLDPGLGFAKTSEQSVAVLRDLRRVVALGYPVLVGASRKRFVGALTGVSVPAYRVVGSVVAHAIAVTRGARLVRTHDVSATRDGIAVGAAFVE